MNDEWKKLWEYYEKYFDKLKLTFKKVKKEWNNDNVMNVKITQLL